MKQFAIAGELLDVDLSRFQFVDCGVDLFQAFSVGCPEIAAAGECRCFLQSRFVNVDTHLRVAASEQRVIDRHSSYALGPGTDCVDANI